jgi:Ca-activated chloride channel family protein
MTEFLAPFHLLRPWALLLLVPALGLWWLARQSADTTRRWRKVIDPDLLKFLVVGGGRGVASRRIAPHDVLLLGWIVATIAIAGPAWRLVPTPFADQAPPAMIVLKVTPTMTTADLAPTRLDRARQKIVDLLKLRDGMPAGLVAYSGSAHLVLPPTGDHSVLSTMAGALSPAIMPREGDALADAVALAVKVLREGGQGGSILVVADTVAPGQDEALARAAAGVPVTLLAVAPTQAVEHDAALEAAAKSLDARLIPTVIDGEDVETVARRLARAPAAPVAGEAERWQEAGYWLTPLLALLSLLWFRRGWVLPA